VSTFQIILMPEAQADIKCLDLAVQVRILDKLDWMGENARLLRHQALQGQEWSGCFKYRIGNYRIIYQVDWSAERLLVLKVGHRRDVYG
jgi:mRNA interferase RelE/StbE